MHTPTKAQMQVVIDNLKKVLPMAVLPGHLNMSEARVNGDSEHACGTIHCFGGWYAIAVCNPDYNKLDYENGKYQIAYDLGFTSNRIFHVDAFDLREWADQYPKLWGNQCGIRMFNDSYAFYNVDKRPYGAENLQHIIDHLEEVRDRLPA